MRIFVFEDTDCEPRRIANTVNTKAQIKQQIIKEEEEEQKIINNICISRNYGAIVVRKFCVQLRRQHGHSSVTSKI